MRGPAWGERPVVVTLASGEERAGQVVGHTPAGLRLRDPASGDEVDLPAGEVRDLKLAAGPLREGPPPGPLEEAVGEAWTGLFTPGPGGVRPVVLCSGAALGQLSGATCLVRPTPRGEAARGAGFVVEVTDPDGPAARLVRDGRAVLLRTAAGLRPLVHHLRALLRLTDGRTGAAVLFRPWLPGVLLTWARTLDAPDVAALFGATTRVDGAATRQACPVCGERDPGPACRWCDAAFVSGRLLEALVVAGGPRPLALRPRTEAPRPAGDARGAPAFTLRPDQVEALGWDHARRHGLPGLEAELRAHLTSTWADRARDLGPAGVEALVADAVARAARHRVWAALDVTRLLDVALLLDDREVERRPWAWSWREALDDPHAPAALRVERFAALALDEVRARAARHAEVQ